MRRLIIILGIIVLTSPLYSQDWMMVSQLSGTGSSYPTNSVTDSDGNIYILGYYTGTISQGTYSVSSAAGTQDIFLTKYDKDGNILWLKSIGSDDASPENPAGIAINTLNDAVYVCGDFRDTCYFGASALISQGLSDAFLAKYSISGNLIWAKNIVKGANNQRVWSVDVDAGGYVVVSGFFVISADFDPGPTLFTNGFNSPFVARYDDNGTFQWAKGFLGKNNNNNFRDIVAADDGYIISGQMRDSLFLDIDTLIPGDASIDLYVIKLDFNGNGMWARKLRGAVGQEIFSRLRVYNDNVYAVGMTQAATLLIDSTATDVISKNIGNAGNNDMFITSFSGDGTFRWCNRWGSAGDDRTEYISAKADKILVTGRHAAALTVGSFPLTWLASSDAYRIVMDTTGVVTSVNSIRGTASEIGTACNIDYEDNDVLIGAFTSANLTIGSVTLANAGSNDVYIAKYGCPKVTPAFTTDSVTCPSGNDGTATVTPSGMTSYLWSTTETTETITNLTAGTYIVTVTGLYGCKYVDSVEVAEKPGLSTAMAASTYEINCAGGSDGVGIVSASDGKPAYSYLWDNTITNDTVINLTAGVHYVSVTDGCTTKVDSIEITYKPTLFANLSKHAELLICALDTNGEVTVQITDGVPPFTYTWDDGVYPGAARNNLDTGWHYVSVTDICNVPNIDSIRVNYLPEVNINITSSSPASCPVGGDGYAYALALSGVPPYTYIWSNSVSTTNEATDLLTGWQYVTVSDYCRSSVDSIQVVSDPVVTSSVSIVSPVTCTGLNNGSATVTATLGKTPYGYLWSSAETTATATSLVEGWNYVTVSDACTSVHVDSIQVGIESTLTDTVNLTAQASCPVSSDGSATVTVLSGVPGYSYLWTNGSTLANPSDLTVGWHYVTITDGCGPKVDSVEVTNKPLLSVSLSTTNILLTCATDLGTATVLTQDGVAPFSYVWDDMIAPGATRNDLDTGWHYVTVTDVCNNPFTGSVRVNHLPEVMTLIVSSTPSSCPPGGDGAATVQTYSGVPPYNYTWSNSSSTSATASDLLTGWQYVTVSDFCTSRIDSIEVVSNPPLETSISAVVPANCSGAFNGSATVTPSNGGGGYTYLWTSGEITATATTLGEGMNYVTVSDVCLSEKVDSVITYVQSALVASVSLSSQATCPTSSDGKATVDISSGVAPFTYVWSSGGTGETEPGLPVGWVYVTITDGCGPKVDSVEITNKPVLQVSLSTNNILLTCAVDLGTVTVQTQDGVTPFIYTWDDGVYPNPTRSLDTGWHYVTVTDFCNMPYYDSVRVNHLPEVVVDIVSSAVASCPSGGDGSATVQASSGVPPYDYAWSNSASNSATANDLLSGWQYVTVSDYCTSRVDSVEIGYKPALEAAISDSSNVSCFGVSNGSASVTTANGGLPYTYLWTSGEANAMATQLQAGWNYVTVSDLCGTVIIDSVEIFVNTMLSITSIQVSPTSCDGGNNGSATVITSGGSAPITYLWSDASTNQTAYNLTNDTVFVTVTDACGFLSTSAYVDHLPLMEIAITANVPASCPTSADGKAFVTALYGSGFYSYQWSNSASLSATATDLIVGVNYVTVTDACGFLVDSVEITNKPLLNGTVQNTGPATCPTDSDGVAIATPVDGVQPYSYAWSASVSSDSMASDLPVGINTVTITDVCGSVVLSVTVTSLPAMTYTAEILNLFCFSDSSGSIEIIPSSGVPPYSFLWADTTLTDSVRTGLLSGTYTVTISDACGSTTQPYTLSQPGALSISLLPTNVQFQGESTGIIDLIVSGGTAPHFYVWSNSSQLEDQRELTEGTYAVTVTDNNGCMAIDSVEIISLMKHIVIYSAFTPNADGKNDVWNIKYINNFPECEVNIYNEWGVAVFKSTGYQTPWDGTKDGKVLPAGSYYYVIDLKDGSEAYTGSVTLMK